MAFMQSTYETVANLAEWDRHALGVSTECFRNDSNDFLDGNMPFFFQIFILFERSSKISAKVDSFL
jgi:hypothetical protein